MNKLFFLAFIFLGGCVSLDKVESLRETNNKTSEYTYSDSESKVRYQITNDEKNLHIKLNTTEITSIQKILRTGLKICFDVKGKKNNTVFFQYPLAQTLPASNQTASKTVTAKETKLDLAKMVAQIPGEAILSRNGVAEKVLVASSDIKVSIVAANNNEITYDLVIPFNRITQGGLSSLSKLSLGVISGKIESTTMDGDGPDGMPPGGGGPGGEGPGGDGPGGGPMGGPDGGGPGGDMFSPSLSDPIKFWFKVILH